MVACYFVWFMLQKNAAVGGVVTGAMLSVSDGIINQDKMVRTALTAGALATAADLLKFF